MNKFYILFLIVGIFSSIKCNSQISFVKGYYIDNANQKTEGLIRNVDWKNNPLEFEYKKTKESEKESMNIESVKEFGINNVSKYIRASVQIDRSSNKFNLLSYDKSPLFKKEQLYLKVLIQGYASLFLYEDNSLRRYFYQTVNNDVDQLIFKKYKTPENKIGTNNKFRNQLYDNLKCVDISMEELKFMNYNKKELLNLFEKYNNCHNSEFVNFDEKVTSSLFHLNIRPGLNSSSLSMRNNITNSRNTGYDREWSFRVGLEFEFILGFNKNKWAIIIEPTYQYFKAELEIANRSNTNADYQSIELPLGLRHYLFLNDTSKVFVNASFLYDFALKSKVRNLAVGSGINGALGIGYKYKNTCSLEFRYHTSRDILPDYALWTSDYKTISVIFGYSIF
ncbi:MAG: tRNA modification GTPase [Nonlabens sp.]|uniref:tRNA modification GTPase n=1 Tax=Nonlabens sp. TaxID=1888209 RepID=UPI0035A7452F